MAVTPVGSLVIDDNSGAAASVAVPTGADTDLEVAFGGSDFYTLGTFGPPSGTGWSLRFTVDRGANDSKTRVWTRTAPAGGHTVTLAPINDEEVWLAIRRLAGADLANPVIDVDGATSANSNHTAPALALGAEVGYLLGAAMTEVFQGGSDYTPPTGFNELADIDLAGNAASAAVAEDQSAGPGDVGPFTFVYGGTGDPGLAIVIAIRAASTGTDLVVQDATQEQVADTVSLVVILAVADATQEQVADTVSLVVNLAVQDATQEQVADSPALQVSLSVDDAVQLQVADTVALAVNLTVQDATQEQVADTVSLTVDLGADDAVQLQVADNVALSGTLAVQDATQEQVAGSPALGPGLVRNALLKPSWYGYPDGTTTGTIAALTPVTGAIDVFANDTVIEDLDIDAVADGYGIFVAAGVTGTIIRNVKITTIPAGAGGGIVISDAVGGPTLIEDVEIEYLAPGSGRSAIIGPLWIADRVLFNNVSEGPRMQDGCILRNSYVPSILVTDPGFHADGVQVTGADTYEIDHNTIDPVASDVEEVSSAAIIGSELAPNLNGVLTNNLLNRGGFTLQFGASTFEMDNFTATGNRFGRDFVNGPYASAPVTNLTWANNVFDDDNSEIAGPPITVAVQDAVQLQVADNVTLTFPGLIIPELTGTVTTPGLTGTLTTPGLAGTVSTPGLTGIVEIE